MCALVEHTTTLKLWRIISPEFYFNSPTCVKVLIPLVYLGVHLFKGKPKLCHFGGIVDKIKAKLQSWEGRFLSIAGQMVFVKLIVHPMMLHSMMIYLWPKSILTVIERWCKNFIWSRSILASKSVIVPWNITTEKVWVLENYLQSINLQFQNYAGIVLL